MAAVRNQPFGVRRNPHPPSFASLRLAFKCPPNDGLVQDANEASCFTLLRTRYSQPSS